MVWVAEELARRWQLPHWRFTNSGTEATMDAVRIARALTGRDTVLKIAGSYHGHHDYVMVSVGVAAATLGGYDDPEGIPYGAGIPDAVVRLTVPVPFNDADALERRIDELAREDRLPACLIMEAALMNLGVVLPREGYLDAVRDITRRHGIVWIVDEVKTGLTVAPGGATQRFGLRPDLVTLAKTLAAGLPSGAVGGTAEAMAPVRDGTVYQVGTFNGNPLSMAAARASLEKVLVPDAYARIEALNERILAGCRDVLQRHELPGYAVGIGAKGVVTFSPAEIVDHVTYARHQDPELTELAWAYAMNRGIFMTPGREEEWTLSVAHTEADVDRYVEVFDDLASEVVRA
jgi:glutamate-1-semialdehyde 2,1-aminomutase